MVVIIHRTGRPTKSHLFYPIIEILPRVALNLAFCWDERRLLVLDAYGQRHHQLKTKKKKGVFFHVVTVSGGGGGEMDEEEIIEL